MLSNMIRSNDQLMQRAKTVKPIDFYLFVSTVFYWPAPPFFIRLYGHVKNGHHRYVYLHLECLWVKNSILLYITANVSVNADVAKSE